MAIVVSDTSPIRALAHLQALPWLADLFGQVVVPPGVMQELENPPGHFASVRVSAWPFMALRPPQDMHRVDELRLTLDSVEVEAIAVAEEIQADAILMDESAGRAIARGLGLTVVDTLGILLRAKQVRLCVELKPLLVRLQQEINFFISPPLMKQILQQAGELPPE